MAQPGVKSTRCSWATSASRASPFGVVRRAPAGTTPTAPCPRGTAAGSPARAAAGGRARRRPGPPCPRAVPAGCRRPPQLYDHARMLRAQRGQGVVEPCPYPLHRADRHPPAQPPLYGVDGLPCQFGGPECRACGGDERLAGRGGVTRCVVRSNKGAPGSRSRARTVLETADRTTCSRLAAAVKPPASATETTTSICRSSTIRSRSSSAPSGAKATVFDLRRIVCGRGASCGCRLMPLLVPAHIRRGGRPRPFFRRGPVVCRPDARPGTTPAAHRSGSLVTPAGRWCRRHRTRLSGRWRRGRR